MHTTANASATNRDVACSAVVPHRLSSRHWQSCASSGACAVGKASSLLQEEIERCLVQVCFAPRCRRLALAFHATGTLLWADAASQLCGHPPPCCRMIEDRRKVMAYSPALPANAFVASAQRSPNTLLQVCLLLHLRCSTICVFRFRTSVCPWTQFCYHCKQAIALFQRI